MGFDEGEEMEGFGEESGAGDFEGVGGPAAKEGATDEDAGDGLLFVGGEEFGDVEADFGEFGEEDGGGTDGAGGGAPEG